MTFNISREGRRGLQSISRFTFLSLVVTAQSKLCIPSEFALFITLEGILGDRSEVTCFCVSKMSRALKVREFNSRWCYMSPIESDLENE